MPPCELARTRDVYRLECDDGRRYIVYNASALGNPPDHVPDNWYLLAYPRSPQIGDGHPFESADEAERAARDAPPGADGPSRSGR